MPGTDLEHPAAGRLIEPGREGSAPSSAERDLLDELAGRLGPPDEGMVAEADALLDELAKSPRRRGRRAPAA